MPLRSLRARIPSGVRAAHTAHTQCATSRDVQFLELRRFLEVLCDNGIKAHEPVVAQVTAQQSPSRSRPPQPPAAARGSGAHRTSSTSSWRMPKRPKVGSEASKAAMLLFDASLHVRQVSPSMYAARPQGRGKAQRRRSAHSRCNVSGSLLGRALRRLWLTSLPRAKAYPP